MSTGNLIVDLDRVVANWRALDALSSATTETAAVVKADGYGLGADRVAMALWRAGARRFFIAAAEEGASLRRALGAKPEILVFSGHMNGDTALLRDHALTPMINSTEQLIRHLESLPGHPFGVQLDSGMHRLGLGPAEWDAVRTIALGQSPVLIISHLACADEPAHPMNARQLERFRAMTQGVDVPLSLAATGGILLGPEYHFDLTRPGIGLYGGAPFDEAGRVVTLDLPVIQTVDLNPGDTVGYGNTFTATGEMRIATLGAGYADGIHRLLGARTALHHGDRRCPLIGRISMDMMAADITDLEGTPKSLQLLGPHQGVDDLAANADTIGYEILTSLGARYQRNYRGG